MVDGSTVNNTAHTGTPTLARSQRKCGYYLGVRIAARTQLPFAITHYTMTMCEHFLCALAISCWPAHCDISSSGTLTLQCSPNTPLHNIDSPSHSSTVIIDKRRPPFPKSSCGESHVFTHCVNTQQYCCAVERSALCCNMPSLWMLAQWRYPGHLNTQGSPRVIVNQIMIPWLHCIVISVTQPFRYILYHAVTNLEASALFCFGVFFLVNVEVRNCQYAKTPFNIVLHIFGFLLLLSQGSVWQTRYVFRADECMEQHSFQICWHRITVSILSLTERDAFDTLFDHAPDKLNVVKKVCRLSSGGLRCIITVPKCSLKAASHSYSIGSSRFFVVYDLVLFLIALFLNRPWSHLSINI